MLWSRATLKSKQPDLKEGIHHCYLHHQHRHRFLQIHRQVRQLGLLRGLTGVDGKHELYPEIQVLAIKKIQLF